MTGKGKHHVVGSMQECLAYWNDREMQLVRLHEEILARREAMLNCSMAYQQSQDIHYRHQASSVEQAYIRNQCLLKDIRKAQEEAFEALVLSPSPRFMTLQKNYWSMVKSQVPLWEKDLGMSPTTTARSKAASQRSARRKSPSGKSPHAQSSGSQDGYPSQGQTNNEARPEKTKGITPRKHKS